MTRDTADWYRDFARQCARVSPLYEAWAHAVAADPGTIELLDRLPEQHRQPPLVFAVASLLGAREPAHASELPRFLREREAVLARELAARPMQTNEPNRCAAILPALECIPGPLSLIELGASAGLCLYPDRYAYDYSGQRLGGGPVELQCRLAEGTPPPRSLPEIVWRAGVDLRPLNVADEADAAWLDALAWPGQRDRLARVRAASEVVRRSPPLLLRGDAEERLDEVLTLVPAGSTPVILTLGVLVYLPFARRQSLIERIRESGARWISLEGATVIPQSEAALRDAGELRGRFVVALDGHPLAWCGPYGETLDACEVPFGA